MFAFIDRMLGFDACAIYNGYIIINSEDVPRYFLSEDMKYVRKMVCEIRESGKR